MLPLENFNVAKCPGEYGIDQIFAGQKKTLQIQITNARGCALNVIEAFPLTENEEVDTNPTYESSSEVSSSSVEGILTYKYIVKEMHYSTRYIATFIPVPVNLEEGRFKIDVPAGLLLNPGTFLAEFNIIDPEGNLVFVDPRYLQIMPTLNYRSRGPITVADVRMAMWDYCPEDNTLIDDLQFNDEQIMFAIRRPIDRWNETTPHITSYTPKTFPFREHWLIGTIGYLYRTAAHNYRRNNLQYQAGGVAVNDKDKSQEYEMMAKERIGEFDSWMHQKKIEMNIALGFGTLRSGYSSY